MEGHYYRPTLALTLALDATFWGLNPAWFHLTNILLHVGVTFLVNRLVLAMGARRDIAILATLLFAVHPVHVEVVAFVAARVNLLLSIGVLGCLLAYRRADTPGRGRFVWGGAALAMQAFALFSKEAAVTLPALLVLSDLVHSPASDQPAERTSLRRALMRSLPFWIVTVAFATVRFSQLLSIAGDRLQGGGLWRRLPGSLELLARYVVLSLVPTHMQPFYSLKRPESFLGLWPALGLLLGGGLVVLLIWSWRRAPLVAYGTAWFLVTISPVVDLVPLSPRDMGLADRYLYLPSVGVSILLALGFAALLGPTDGQRWSFRRLVAWGGPDPPDDRVPVAIVPLCAGVAERPDPVHTHDGGRPALARSLSQSRSHVLSGKRFATGHRHVGAGGPPKPDAPPTAHHLGTGVRPPGESA